VVATVTTTVSPARPCSPARGVAREQAILDAAMELVAEIGYDRITMDAVATRAQASKATMYRKWPSKAELIFAGLRRRCEAEGECVPDTGSLRGDLVAVVAQMSEGISGDDGALFLGLLEAFRMDDVLRGLFEDKVTRQSGQTAAVLLDRAVGRRESVRNVDGQMVIQLAFAQLFMTTLLSGKPPTPAAQRCLVDDVLLPLLAEPRS
jgi:AcrR family transcriptional regulator